jgi:hypothetical protein
MKALICGGRKFNDMKLASSTLDRLRTELGFTNIIQGGATGADTIAMLWANSRGVPNVTYPAQWNIHGKKAGPMRNTQMLEEGKPDVVIAFPGDKGTRDMVSKAEAAGVKVILV